MLAKMRPNHDFLSNVASLYCSWARSRLKPIALAKRSLPRSTAELSTTSAHLLESGVNPNIVGADGTAALMAATLFANARMVGASSSNTAPTRIAQVFRDPRR